MKNFLKFQNVGRVRSPFTSTLTLAVTALVASGAVLIPSSVASAVGSAVNVITVSAAPSAGSVRGSYTPKASATSQDKVLVTLDKTSTGCSLSSGKVTFTAQGTCVVDFNDPGNSTYAAAAQVSQSIKVFPANVITASKAPGAGSTGGSYSPGAVATSGDTVVKTLDKTSTGCSLSSGKVTFTGPGTCRVDFNDGGNGAFAAATQVQQSVKVYAANTIDPGTPPAAGTIHGSYTPSATATSGDAVKITLDASSTGCALAKGVVTFTENGVCRVNFNDVGNGAFAPARQVQQDVTVGTGNPRTQATLTLVTKRFIYGHPLVLTSRGGSGSGAVSYAVANSGSAGCFFVNGVLKSTRPGTCTIRIMKAGDASYKATMSLTSIAILLAHPRATRINAAVWTGRTVSRQISGTQFYGIPRIVTNARGTKVTVLRDNGHILTIRVRVLPRTTRGVHTFTLIFAHGQRTSIRYIQR